MSGFDNEKRGALFRNAEKKTDRSPDYSGRITIEGVEYQLAGWLEKSQGGLQYLSIRARVPEPIAEQTPVESSQTTDQSEIPF